MVTSQLLEGGCEDYVHQCNEHQMCSIDAVTGDPVLIPKVENLTFYFIIADCGGRPYVEQGYIMHYVNSAVDSTAKLACSEFYETEYGHAVCTEKGEWNISIACKAPRDCQRLKYLFRDAKSGVYDIAPVETYVIQAYCEMDVHLPGIPRGWTVIQRRMDGSVSFNRTWDLYERGFGIPSGEHWLGNSVIHNLLRNRGSFLLVMVKFQYEEWKFALYTQFMVDGSDLQYKLSFGQCFGNASNALGNQAGSGRYFANQTKFSTIDQDNDKLTGTNCAKQQG
ncbi:ficolin-1-like, partial [Saccostrea cucullata]|uniref:ficolin-1-like n=1 Tax=Saccostrea cuccullata TaxID=36930 RepID=UPI002ED65C4F